MFDVFHIVYIALQEIKLEFIAYYVQQSKW